jgi:hypothetical protein
MSEQSPQYKFPGEIDDLRSVGDHRRKLHTEQPIDPMINREMLMPSPLDPMGQIAAEGRGFRNLAQGRMPTWVIMMSWATFGFGNFLLCGLLLQNSISEATIALGQRNYDRLWLSVFSVLPQLIFSGLIWIVLCRATWRRR